MPIRDYQEPYSYFFRFWGLPLDGEWTVISAMVRKRNFADALHAMGRRAEGTP
jgi:hypothetical protein